MIFLYFYLPYYKALHKNYAKKSQTSRDRTVHYQSITALLDRYEWIESLLMQAKFEIDLSVNQ